MADSFLRTEKEIAEIYERHVKTVYRICFSYLKTHADAEDAVSDSFVRLIRSGKTFRDTEHEKAWLIRVAINVCKDSLKHWRRRQENLEDYLDLQDEEHFEIDETFRVVMELPDKYKTVIFLYYYEEYTTPEISRILKKPQSTIRNYLHEARKLLKTQLGGDFYEG